AAGAVVAGRVSPNADKDFLDHVFGRQRIAEHLTGQPLTQASITIVEGRESRRVTARQPIENNFVALLPNWHCRHRRNHPVVLPPNGRMRHHRSGRSPRPRSKPATSQTQVARSIWPSRVANTHTPETSTLRPVGGMPITTPCWV